MMMMAMMMVILMFQGLAEKNQGGWKATCGCGGGETGQEEVENIPLKIFYCKYLCTNIDYWMQISHEKISNYKYPIELFNGNYLM